MKGLQKRMTYYNIFQSLFVKCTFILGIVNWASPQWTAASSQHFQTENRAQISCTPSPTKPVSFPNHLLTKLGSTWTETSEPFLTASPTSAPAQTTIFPTAAPTPTPTLSPTPEPTPSEFDIFCRDPIGDPCVGRLTDLDKVYGGGVYHDLECNSTTGSVVGCDHGGFPLCRLCVFNRELYSEKVLGGADVPYVDCPCCVPEVYGLQGDIDCDWEDTPAPVQSGTTATLAPGSTAPPTSEFEISMEGCEKGQTNGTLCVDLASTIDLERGIGVYYEEDCSGLGCNILGKEDCRQCVFDWDAYNEQVGSPEGLTLVDCPCCVPMTYGFRPESSECVWPPTPSPTAAPTLSEAARNVLSAAPSRWGSRPFRGAGNGWRYVVGAVGHWCAVVGVVMGMSVVV
ncbi:unnamed protein product [Choristocarpus tenellus]